MIAYWQTRYIFFYRVRKLTLAKHLSAQSRGSPVILADNGKSCKWRLSRRFSQVLSILNDMTLQQWSLFWSSFAIRYFWLSSLPSLMLWMMVPARCWSRLRHNLILTKHVELPGFLCCHDHQTQIKKRFADAREGNLQICKTGKIYKTNLLDGNWCFAFQSKASWCCLFLHKVQAALPYQGSQYPLPVISNCGSFVLLDPARNNFRLPKDLKRILEDPWSCVVPRIAFWV